MARLTRCNICNSVRKTLYEQKLVDGKKTWIAYGVICLNNKHFRIGDTIMTVNHENEKIEMCISTFPELWTNQSEDEKFIPQMLENLKITVEENFSNVEIIITDEYNGKLLFFSDPNRMTIADENLLAEIDDFINRLDLDWESQKFGKCMACGYVLNLENSDFSEMQGDSRAYISKKLLEYHLDPPDECIEKYNRFNEINLKVIANFEDVKRGAESVFHKAIAYYQTYLDDTEDRRLFLSIEDLEENDNDLKFSDVELSSDYYSDDIVLENLDINHDLMMNFNPAVLDLDV